MAPAILNQETIRIPIFFYCVIKSLPRLNPEEVVQSLLDCGWNKDRNGNFPIDLAHRTLENLNVGVQERVRINQTRLDLEQRGKGYNISAGKKGSKALLKILQKREKEDNAARLRAIQENNQEQVRQAERVKQPLERVTPDLEHFILALREMVDADLPDESIIYYVRKKLIHTDSKA